MSIALYNEVLKQGVNDLYTKAKITLASKTMLNTFIDENLETNFIEISYSSFNQTDSTGIVFDDEARTGTTTNSVPTELITNVITIPSGVVLDSIMLKLSGVDFKTLVEDLTILMSYDGITYFSIPSYDIKETISYATTQTGVYLKFTWDASSVITGLYLMYRI